jgi:hypothetical protein
MPVFLEKCDHSGRTTRGSAAIGKTVGPGTADGILPFQQYFVAPRCIPAVRGISFQGSNAARPTPACIDALTIRTPRAVIICPSNPFAGQLLQRSCATTEVSENCGSAQFPHFPDVPSKAEQ